MVMASPRSTGRSEELGEGMPEIVSAAGTGDVHTQLTLVVVHGPWVERSVS